MNAPPPGRTAGPLSLVVTADDFGIGVRTSQGIILAHQRGPVTATSFMSIAGDFARGSVPLLAEAPDLDVGLHLVLTSCGHKPLVAGRSSGIVGRDGYFLSNARLWMKAWSGRLEMAPIADEIAAQAEMFVRLVGRPPAYVDGHHHAHQLPVVREALMEIIRRQLLPAMTRLTIEPPALRRQVPGAAIRRRAAHFLGRRAARVFTGGGIRGNDFFFGMLAPGALRRESPWKDYLQHLPSAGIVEWVVHPGLDDPTLEGRDPYRAERPAELAALTEPPGATAWEHLRPLLTRKSLLAVS